VRQRSYGMPHYPIAAQVQKAACGLGKAEVPSSILGSGSRYHVAQFRMSG